MIVTTTRSAELDSAALLQRLARPAPAQIEFTEVRFSPLLKEAATVSGQLQYSGATSLDRRITRPYKEETQIRGDAVRVMREGEPVRSFALRRAPELRGLLTGFTAMLSGDLATLQREFSVRAMGDDGAWTLELEPIDSRTRKRLQKIEVSGSQDQPRCFSLMTDNGGISLMLLGESAKQTLPAPITREALMAICKQGDRKSDARLRSEETRVQSARVSRDSSSAANTNPASQVPHS